MNPTSKLRNLWHRITGMDLQQCHTAIAFHWADCSRPDVTFMLRGILRAEALHTALDALIEEHAYSATHDVITDVTVFWHTDDGHWDCEEIQSRFCSGTSSYNRETEV